MGVVADRLAGDEVERSGDRLPRTTVNEGIAGILPLVERALAGEAALEIIPRFLGQRLTFGGATNEEGTAQQDEGDEEWFHF